MVNMATLTVKIGTEELNDEASRKLSRFAKRGFIVGQQSYTLDKDGSEVAHFIMYRERVTHDGELISIGPNAYYWSPCGDTNDVG